MTPIPATTIAPTTTTAPLPAKRRRSGLWGVVCGLVLSLVAILSAGAGESASNMPVRIIAVREAVEAALLNNRALQIERINPALARDAVSAAYGAFDPLFVGQARREKLADSGAFDPANPAVDTGFETESALAGFGLTGLLPTGLIYDLSGSQAHSEGSRNFLNFDSYRVAAGVYLEQPLLRNAWIDLPRLAVRVNRRNVEISEQGVRFVAMDLVTLVLQGYADLVLAWETLEVQRELLSTRSQFLVGIRRQVELGKLTVLEERVAESQRAKVQTDLVGASNLVALAGNQLRTLMGLSRDQWNEQVIVPADRPVATEPDLDLGASWRHAIALRPDLIQLAKGVENADLNLKFRRNQLFPGLSIVGSYGRRGASSVQAFPPDQPRADAAEAFDQLSRGDAPSEMIGLVFSVPLGRTAERAQYRAGKKLKQQAELLVKQKEEMVMREVSDAFHSARFSFDRVRSAGVATVQARGALQAEEDRFKGGKSSINFVLQFQSDVAAARLAEAQAKADFHQAMAKLHFAEASILDRHGIDLEFK